MTAMLAPFFQTKKISCFVFVCLHRNTFFINLWNLLQHKHSINGAFAPILLPPLPRILLHFQWQRVVCEKFGNIWQHLLHVVCAMGAWITRCLQQSASTWTVARFHIGRPCHSDCQHQCGCWCQINGSLWQLSTNHWLGLLASVLMFVWTKWKKWPGCQNRPQTSLESANWGSGHSDQEIFQLSSVKWTACWCVRTPISVCFRKRTLTQQEPPSAVDECAQIMSNVRVPAIAWPVQDFNLGSCATEVKMLPTATHNGKHMEFN